MSERRDLLVEIGTEELPPKALARLSAAFRDGLIKGLNAAELPYDSIREYATPRRLALHITQLTARQQDKQVERRGPALTAAFDETGMPTSAALGFARSCGVEVDQLERLETDKGAWLVFRSAQKGRRVHELLPQLITDALNELPIPKRMRWGDCDAEFVRPVHWVVVLFGDDVIDCEILGVKAGRQTRGHRFHHAGSLYVAEPAAYAPLLETEGRVMPSFAARREAIYAQVVEAAVAAGGKAVIDEDLLDEVAALVEWPVALRGQFDERFLAVPDVALISSMQGHQKYFPVRDANGALLPCFITVANIESRDMDVVRRGNERVIRPRLEDAMFFYERDLATPLEKHLQALGSVVFQKQLGTLRDKTNRVKALAGAVCDALDLDAATKARAERAAELSKCDLLTHMVGEFPELQGVMGREYAFKQGEDAMTAAALDEQYWPRFAGDRLPETPVGRAVALSDKLDTLCGIFHIGLIPTGDKDPFGLRRAALGILRVIIEQELDIDLRVLIEKATQPFAGVKRANAKDKPVSVEETVTLVFNYTIERLRAYYADGGVSPDVFEAVLHLNPTRPLDFHRRVRAVMDFRALPEAAALAAANKRIHNILRQVEEKLPTQVDASLLVAGEEKVLAERLQQLQIELAPLWESSDYAAGLSRLASLKEAVDGFFDNVMVMTDDKRVRDNRLALLATLQQMFLRVADFSRLQS